MRSILIPILLVSSLFFIAIAFVMLLGDAQVLWTYGYIPWHGWTGMGIVCMTVCTLLLDIGKIGKGNGS